MFKKVALALAVCSAVAVSSFAQNAVAADAASARTPTIAVINLPLIMTEIPQAKAMEQTLAKEFGPREQAIQQMQQKGQKLTSDLQAGKFKGEEQITKQRELAQLQADFQLKFRALQEDQQKRIQEEQRKLTIAVQKAIDTIAKERGIDLVLRGEAVAFTINELDISDEVIKRVSTENGKKKK